MNTPIRRLLPSRLWLIATVLAVALASLSSTPVFAAHTNPNLNLNQALAFRHVVETDDLLVLIWYELPKAEWRTPAAGMAGAHMVVTSCLAADQTAIKDTSDWANDCWTSLNEAIVVQTLWDGAGGTSNLKSLRALPRVGHGLSAVYLKAGHGLTWNTTTFQTCIEGSASTWTTVPRTCLNLNWQDSASLTATPAVIEPWLVQLMLNLQQSNALPKNTFVSGAKITQTGTIFPREAFPVIMSIVPGAFFVGIAQAFQDFSPSTATPLSSSISTEAQASTVWKSVNSVRAEYLGVSVRTFGAIGFMLAALAVAIGAMMTMGNPAMAAFLGAMVVAVGVFMDLVPLAAVFVALAVMVVLGGAWLFRRVPG